MNFKNMNRNSIVHTFTRIQIYQLECALLLSAVPILCGIALSTILLTFAQRLLVLQPQSPGQAG